MKTRYYLIVGLVAACRSHGSDATETTVQAHGSAAKIHDAAVLRIAPTEMAHIPAGAVRGLVSTCDGDTKGTEVRFASAQVGNFEIDVDTVSCDLWTECVATGRCVEAVSAKCDAGKAAVPIAAATAYCEGRHGQLPSWNEWTRAMHGDEQTPLSVAPHHGSDCLPASEPKRAFGRRCVYTTALGVSYAFSSPNNGEWTRDSDCRSSSRRAVMVELSDESQAYYGVQQEVAEFRCVSAE